MLLCFVLCSVSSHFSLIFIILSVYFMGFFHLVCNSLPTKFKVLIFFHCLPLQIDTEIRLLSYFQIDKLLFQFFNINFFIYGINSISSPSVQQFVLFFAVGVCHTYYIVEIALLGKCSKFASKKKLLLIDWIFI